MNKEIVILVLLGLITKTQAVKGQVGTSGHYTHANAALKTLVSPWWDENAPAPDEGDDGSSLPWATQKTYTTLDCRSPLLRLLDEGDKRIGVPAGQQFEDKSFPVGQAIEWNKYRPEKWARITEKQTSPSLYGSKGIQEGAVKQGSLGDCWLLASIAALGEWPERVHKLMNGQKSWPANGQFTLNFYAYGTVKRVTVDDKLPFAWADVPLFAKKSDAGAWWATIVEKASAKFYGNYEVMKGGSVDAALAVLTGMPSTVMRVTGSTPKEADALWAKMRASEQAGYIMTGGVNRPANSQGLPRGHAYTILGAQMLGTTKVVKIRNPWGGEHYTGSLSDDKLTAAQLGALNHVSVNDGMFFMPMSEFATVFSDICISYYDSWQRNVLQTSWDRKADIKTLSYKIDNPTEQRAMIGLAGVQGRMFLAVGGCRARERIDTVTFRLHNSSGTLMVDSNARHTYWLTGGIANSAFYFEKLPKGTYTVTLGGTAPQQWWRGAMPFAVTTFAIDNKISVTA